MTSSGGRKPKEKRATVEVPLDPKTGDLNAKDLPKMLTPSETEVEEAE